MKLITIALTTLILTGCSGGQVYDVDQSVKHMSLSDCDIEFAALVQELDSDQARYSFHEFGNDAVTVLHFQDVGIQVVMVDNNSGCMVSEVSL